MRKLKEELKREIEEDLGAGQWLDQEQSVLGRNKHVAACKRLIRHDSADAYFDGERWLMRTHAVDEEIRRRNRELAVRLPPTEPPAPMTQAPLAKTTAVETEPDEDEDGSAIYEREFLARLRGAR